MAYSTSSTPPTVAVFNGDTRMSARFQRRFHHAGVEAVVAEVAALESREMAAAFLRRHRAQAVVYELPPPSESGWTMFQRLYGAAQALGAPFVISSAAEHDRTDGASTPGDSEAQIAETVHIVCRLLGITDAPAA
jgi:hypothetical protein